MTDTSPFSAAGGHARIGPMRFLPAFLVVAVLSLGLGLPSGPLPSAASAQDMETPTIQVGQQAPDFLLQDAEGATYRLQQLTRNGPVVLEFFRSGGW